MRKLYLGGNFMFEKWFANRKVEFRVMCHYDGAVVYRIAKWAESFNIEVKEGLLESEVFDENGESVMPVFLMVCRGRSSDYKRFKKSGNWDEIEHEGFKTLI
jgi:hypothetical protein